MTNLLQTTFEESMIRFVEHPKGTYEFGIVAKDLAVALEYSQAYEMLKLVKEKYKGTANCSTPGGAQTLSVVWEPGVFQILSKSGKPLAEPFQDELYERILPDIRQTGSYVAPQDYPSALRAVADAYEQKVLAEQQAEQFESERDIVLEDLEQAEDSLDAYRAILSPESCLDLKQVADGLNVPRMGRNNLFKYLRQKKFITQNDVVPYHNRVEEELAVVQTISIEIKGEPYTKQKTKLTFKGLEWLIKKLTQDGYQVNTTARAVWDYYNSNSKN